MTYLLMSLPFIAIALIVFGLGALHARRHRALGPYLSSWAVATASLVVLTVIFDNVMMAAGFFDYGVEHISGIRLGLIPIEDLMYPIAGALLLSGLWQMLGVTGPREEGRDA
ncbi:lycopene cyclase domain-containing protein [Microbacterium murale]|uniref:Lycopene cyclase domain-containing protein n=1 Tax=Microbacterium murale TaxID=1081040 RepID=A0ABU0P9N1_9MICO|nr:lycopene cyclase domain-containing protein [Microbacterium murale]MDQ0643359.1 lycopene cyclase domain-containing protein [Microbacterium murale]